MVKNSIAIILARGGSKRLPNKNILKFNKKPLVAWSIEAAINSGLFKRVLVSTDNKSIQSISKKYKADVPFLRSKAADDFSSSSVELIMLYFRQKNIGKKNMMLLFN